MVTRGWNPTPSISAMALAPSLPILLYPRLTLVTQVLFCEKSNEKTRLEGGANQAQNTCNVNMKDLQTTWMSGVVSLVTKAAGQQSYERNQGKCSSRDAKREF